MLQCKIKGSFRTKGIRSTNPVAVGDRVTISIAEAGESHERAAWITAIDERRNYVVRRSTNLSKQSHIIAANVDQALLLVTINHPETSLTFIDRFLAACEAYSVPVVLCFNKLDLLSDDELRLQEAVMTLYRSIGYNCVAISAKHLDDSELLPLLRGKITLLSGNSGVGKSTLINSLIPGATLRTAEISDAHNTGTHTTTFSEMLFLGGEESGEPFNIREGALIHTPGVKGYGSVDMKPEVITSYFRDIFRFSADCRFNNCSHTHEPGCAVVSAVENHYIAQSRYQSYLSMLSDDESDKYRAAY